jgi:hypothetical protein
MAAAATWVLSDCDIILNVKISCVQRSDSGATGKFNNGNKRDYRDDILDVDLDDLCEFRHMAVRPRVREDMNALIVNLELTYLLTELSPS